MLAELDAQLLDGFLSGDEDASRLFKSLATPHVLAFARRFGPDLPASVMDDVVGETWLILVEGGCARFEADRGKLINYLFYVVKRAVQRVRAAYAKPGSRTRYRKGQVQEANVISIDSLTRPPLDEKTQDAFREIEARHDVAALLAGAPPEVALVLIAVHVHDRKLSDVARQLGVSRFRITRAITAFTEDLRNRRAA